MHIHSVCNFYILYVFQINAYRGNCIDDRDSNRSSCCIRNCIQIQFFKKVKIIEIQEKLSLRYEFLEPCRFLHEHISYVIISQRARRCRALSFIIHVLLDKELRVCYNFKRITPFSPTASHRRECGNAGASPTDSRPHRYWLQRDSRF